MESDNTMLINKYDVLNFFNRFQLLKRNYVFAKMSVPSFIHASAVTTWFCLSLDMLNL